jgi:hypothetical protein
MREGSVKAEYGLMLHRIKSPMRGYMKTVAAVVAVGQQVPDSVREGQVSKRLNKD